MQPKRSRHRKGRCQGPLKLFPHLREPQCQELLSPHQGQSPTLRLCHCNRAGCWQRQRARQPLQPLLGLLNPLDLLPLRSYLLLQPIWLTLTRLVVLGCFKQQIFRPETARLVRCHNPWPSEDVLFCPDGALPAFVTGIPALSSGPELWYAVHNHRPEPLQLHAGQSIGVLEVVHLAEAPASVPPSSMHSTSSPCQPPLPENLSPLQQQQLNELFKEYQDVFSQGDEDLGNTPLLEHGIETHGPPLRQPYRRQNPAVRREEMAQVQQMLSSNVIRPSNSPWASPVVMVRKKDGSLRFCVDFRQLNAATVKDAHPLPRIDDLLDALHGAKWFSTLDLKSGYWQVPIAEQDKEKTAFRTSSGQLFEFNQVPFGLCNAPATFSRLMDRVLAGLHWETCLFYLDDIIVFSSTWEEHLARLREVFWEVKARQAQTGGLKVHICRQRGQLPGS